jgi:hypothetical protein
VTVSRWILIMRNISDKSCRDYQNTLFMFSNFFFSKIVTLWDNVEKCGGARQAKDNSLIRRMRFAWWTTKATHTHTFRTCNSHCFSTVTVVSPSRLIFTFIRTLNVLHTFGSELKDNYFRVITPGIVLLTFRDRKHTDGTDRELRTHFWRFSKGSDGRSDLDPRINQVYKTF